MSKYYIYGPLQDADLDMYYSETEADNDMISCFGNNIDWGSDLYPGIDKGLNDAYCDLFSASNCSANDSTPDSMSAHAKDTIIGLKNDLQYYFPFQNPNKKSYTDGECNMLLQCTNDYIGGTSNGQLELVCKVAEAMSGEPFIYGQFSGNSQGDWCNYICPQKLTPKLAFIQSVVMGTANCWEIGLDPCDSPEEFMQRRDDADIDLASDLTTLWDEAEIKKWAAGIIGCNPAEVEIIDATADSDY